MGKTTDHMLTQASLYDPILQAFFSDDITIPIEVSWAGYTKAGPRHPNEDRMASTLFHDWHFTVRVDHREPIQNYTSRLTYSPPLHMPCLVESNLSNRNENITLEDSTNVKTKGALDLARFFTNSIYNRRYHRSGRRQLLSQLNSSVRPIHPKTNMPLSTPFARIQMNLSLPYRPLRTNNPRDTEGVSDSFMHSAHARLLGVDYRLIAWIQRPKTKKPNHQSDHSPNSMKQSSRSGLSGGSPCEDFNASRSWPDTQVFMPRSEEQWVWIIHERRPIVFIRTKGSSEEVTWTTCGDKTSLLEYLLVPPTSNGKIDTPPFEPVLRGSAVQLMLCDGHDQAIGSQFVVDKCGRYLSRAWYDHTEASKTTTAYLPVQLPQHIFRSHVLKIDKLDDLDSIPVREAHVMRRNAVKDVFRRTMHDLESQFRLTAQQYDAENNNKRLTSGTCVLSTLLMGDSVYAAQLGDSMACAITLGAFTDRYDDSYASDSISSTRSTEISSPSYFGLRGIWLTKPMRCDTPHELQRISALGGCLGEEGRLAGVLEPTRTIGDLDVKEMVPEGVLSIIPEVSRYRITRPSIILIGSDGPFDILAIDDVLIALKAKHDVWVNVCSWLTYRPFEEWITTDGSDPQPITQAKPTEDELQMVGKLICKYAIEEGSMDDCSLIVCYATPILGPSFAIFHEDLVRTRSPLITRLRNKH